MKGLTSKRKLKNQLVHFAKNVLNTRHESTFLFQVIVGENILLLQRIDS